MVEKSKPAQDPAQVEEEFQCAICWQLMYKPVTTPCGHTFCKQCLEQALSQKRQCILCQEKIYESSMANLQVNVVVQNIIEKKYPHMSERRQKEHDQHMAQQEERKKKAQFDSKESKIPVIRCDANVFKNM